MSVISATCVISGCATTPRCHRCGTQNGVDEMFVVTNTTPCLAGTTPKVTGYRTHACRPCWKDFTREDVQD